MSVDERVEPTAVIKKSDLSLSLPSPTARWMTWY